MSETICIERSQNNYTRSAECFRFFLNMVPSWLVKEDMKPTTNIFNITLKWNQDHVSKKDRKHGGKKSTL